MTGAVPQTPVARDKTIDIAKGLAIVILPYSHVTLGLNKIGLIPDAFIDWSKPFYLWYMPMLFFTAGLFVEHSLLRDGARRFTLKRALYLGYPFFLWSLVFGITQYFAADYTNTGAIRIDQVFHGLLPWAPREHMWFLPALFLALAIAALAFAVGSRFWRILLLIVATAMFIASPFNLNIEHALTNTLWLALGVLVASTPRLKTWAMSSANGWRDALIALASIALFIVVIFTIIGPGRFFGANAATLFPSAALGIVAAIGISKHLALVPWIGAGLARIGRWTIYIYLTHVFVLAGGRIFMTRVLDINDAVAICLVTIPLCVIVGCICGYLSDRGYISWLFHVPKRINEAILSRGPQPSENSRW